MNWYEVKVSYDKTADNGMLAKVKESYLIEGVSYTDAEARTVEELKPFISGEMEIESIVKKKFSEVVLDGAGEKYYKAKINMITLDEKSGTEKKQAVVLLIEANDFDTAYKRVNEAIKECVSDCEVVMIQETAIIDVFKNERA